MPRQLASPAGVLVITFALAIVFWLVKILFAPHVFFFLWSHLGHGPRSPLAKVVFAATAPVLVAIPFGCGFGFLPWRRPIVIGLLVAVLAVGLNVAHTAWAGLHLVDSLVLLEAALLVALFATATAVGGRVASRWRERQRLAVGSIVLGSLTAITLVSAYLWYQSILVSARAA
jgi:hypothetical protein